jgi:glutathione synthase/RimK-type ligase-like ATP-grasp enzyme
MTDVVFVTGQDMPVADPETPALVAALRTRGVAAELATWVEPYDWAQARLVVVRSTWDYMQRCDEFLAWCRKAAAVTKLVNPLPVLEWNSHKSYLVELADAGVPVVPTTVVPEGSASAAQQAALASRAGTVVVKPAIGGGALGTMRGGSDDAAVAEHLAGLVRRGDVLIQPYVASVTSTGEASLMYFAGEFSHAVRKLPVGGDYRVQQQYGGLTEAWDATDAERVVADAAIAAAPEAVPYARVDLIDVEGLPSLMELELIEPFLFLEYAEGSDERFLDAVVGELS